MVYCEPGPDASPERSLPVQDVAALHPRYGLARRVVNRGEGNRFQQTPLELLGDADNLAVDGREASLEQRAQRRGIEEAPHLGGNGRATRYQPRSPAQDVAREGERADPEELVRRKLAPQAGKVLDRLRERTRIRRQVNHVDRAGRFARQDHGPGSRKVSREAPEHANLIGSSGAAAAERDRQIAAWRVLDARPHDFNPIKSRRDAWVTSVMERD